jgi:hypothetical protein
MTLDAAMVHGSFLLLFVLNFDLWMLYGEPL